MKKHIYNLKRFFNEDAVTYYLLGAWVTDGCIYKSKDRANRKSVTLTSKDKDWLETINQYICPSKPLIKHGKNCFRLMYNSTELGDWFISKGCGERKSLTLQFPKVPEQYLFDFIRGCWDGDGSLSFTKSANKGKNWQCQANLTSGSLEFCKSLQTILMKNAITCKVYPHGRNTRKIEGRTLAPSNTWRVVLSGGGSVYKLVKLLYTTNSLQMPRKANVAKAIIKHRESIFPSLII
jgi:hypothetical protein